MPNTDSVIRPARPSDAERLSEIAFQSKAYWGYEAAFMAACRADLTVSPEALEAAAFFVLEREGQLLGFYSLLNTERGVVLGHLFVWPQAIGQGIGQHLWRHMLRQAQKRKWFTVFIESDPYAEAFYLKQGAERIGWTPSSVFPDRSLPLLRFTF